MITSSLMESEQMLPTVCECGIKTRQWKGDVAVCPRCRWIYIATDNGLIVVKDQAADAMIKEIEKWIDEALVVFIPLPTFQEEAQAHPIGERDSIAEVACAASKRAMLRKTMEDAGLSTTECDLCGGPIEDKCGAVCAGCNWIKPCSLE